MISFKKIGSVIAIVMVLVLCVPAVHSYAADNTEFIIRCRTTVDEASSGLEGVLYGSVLPDGSTNGDLIRQNVIDGLITFDFTQFNGYDYYIVGASLSSGTLVAPSTMNIYVFWFNSADVPLYVTTNTASSFSSNSFYASVGSSFKVQSLYVTTSSYGNWTGVDTITVSNNISGNTSNYGLCTNIQFVLDCNFAVNAGSEIASLSGISGSWGTTAIKNWYFNGGYEQCTDLFEDTEGYDSEGNLVNPDAVGEVSVDPHFGYRKFDSQVVIKSTYARDASYQALLSWETDPIGGNFVTGNAEAWKLHLDCTIDFTVGQYPDGNVLVPEKQMPGSIVFGGDLVNEDLDWYKAGEYLIDPTDAADHMNNAYCQMSGSGFFVPLLAGMKGDYVRGNKSVERYGLLGDALEAVGAASSTLLGSQLITAFNELTGSSIPNWLEEYTNTNYYYAVDAYSINIKGYLVGPSVQSQYGVANSDFVTFTSSGYAQPVTPEATESVPDPQPQQPYQQTNLPAVTPTGYDSQGNMTYVVVNIDNTDNVPSIDGNNNMSYNPTFSPSVNNSTNVDLGIDNVADTLDPLVVQENQSFWNLFNPFKDNAFIEATEDYMGIIPSQLQTIFISSFGILIGLTVYRFIRRG